MFTNKFMFLSKFFKSAIVMTAFIVPLQFAHAQFANKNSEQAALTDDKQKNIKQVPAQQQDPTRPPSVIVQQLSEELAIKPEFELTAIFTRNRQQYAVVNGSVLKTGDALDDMVVTQISDTNITLQNTDSSQLEETLELYGALNIKKQVIK